MQNTQIIAERIKLQAKSKGVTVKKMLLDCSLGPNTVSKVSNGTDVLSQTLSKIADYLDCSVDYLLGRTSEPKTTYENIQSSNIVNGNNGDHSPLTVNKSFDENKELLELIQGLSLKQKAKVITYIYEVIESE